MIRLQQISPYKSLKNIRIKVPDFIILTGLNGAGKTHILEGILSKKILVYDSLENNLNNIKYVSSYSLEPNPLSKPYPSQTKKDDESKIQILWNKFKGFKNIKRQNIEYRLEAVFGDTIPPQPEIKIIKKISELAEKELENLEYEDFFNYYPIDSEIYGIDFFKQNLTSLFQSFSERLEQNQFRQFKNEIKGEESVSFLSDEEFKKTYGEPPWILLNRVFKQTGIPYKVEVPKEYIKGAKYEISLINTLTSITVDFGDLSSGEKVLASLALSIYNLGYGADLPDILLLDEPDASLHPVLIKKLLTVLQEVFINEKKIKVIITTHSPSTVALAPEESIFLVNVAEPRISNVSKDEALKILTAGIPSLSIKYENRRQIFVESDYDVKYYDKVYHKLRVYLDHEISLNFISSGDSRTDKNGSRVSSCEQVINITTLLRTSGNNLVWGIIDWDTKNLTNDFIKVLGDGNRYSIESYLFDPILIAALLLREKLINRKDLGLKPNQTYFDIINLSDDALQIICDFVIEKVKPFVKQVESDLKTSKYLNNKEIKIPVWYLHHNGHELEEIVLKAFPKLNSLKRKSESALKLAIIDKVVDDMPTLLSVDLLEALKYVQQI